jgi:hypothetical protein
METSGEDRELQGRRVAKTPGRARMSAAILEDAGPPAERILRGREVRGAGSGSGARLCCDDYEPSL